MQASAAFRNLQYFRQGPACLQAIGAIVMFFRRAKVAVRKQIAGNSDLAGSG
jgi:hypothetical protein